MLNRYAHAPLSNSILLVRVPRSGLQGSLVGPWMVYFSYPAADLMSSDWVFIEGDGVARVGYSDWLNPMVTLRRDLLAQTRRTAWERTGDVLVLGDEEF